MAKIYFPQYARGRRGVELEPGWTVLRYIRRAGGVEIDTECGGQGTCGKDVIRLERGASALSAVTPAERRLLNRKELEHGRRLAGAGAMLCSKPKRSEAEALKNILTHLKPNEIEGQRFQYLVAENIYFD